MKITDNKFELTKEDYKIAHSNGISTKLAYNRFWVYGWTRIDAITKPIAVQKPSLYKQWQTVCEENKISRSTFNMRVKDDMTPEKASTKPVAGRGRVKSLPEELVKLAESNGISYRQLYMRINFNHYDEQRAATEPINENKRKRGNFDALNQY